MQPSGTKEFFYRYRGRAGELDKLIAIGRYDAAGRNGKTLAAVRSALREIYMDATHFARGELVTTGEAWMQSYIRPVDAGEISLRAMMEFAGQ